MGLHPSGKYVFDEILGHSVFLDPQDYTEEIPHSFQHLHPQDLGWDLHYFLLDKTKKLRIYLFVVLIACFVGNLNTGSRAGFIGIISIIIFYLLVEKQSFSRKSLIIFTLVISGTWMLINFGDFFLARLAINRRAIKWCRKRNVS